LDVLKFTEFQSNLVENVIDISVVFEFRVQFLEVLFAVGEEEHVEDENPNYIIVANFVRKLFGVEPGDKCVEVVLKFGPLQILLFACDKQRVLNYHHLAVDQLDIEVGDVFEFAHFDQLHRVFAFLQIGCKLFKRTFEHLFLHFFVVHV